MRYRHSDGKEVSLD